jgi:hypothetical protein
MDYIADPRMVLFCGDEDSLGRTLKPRLIAAGADMELIRFVAMETDGMSGSVLLQKGSPRSPPMTCSASISGAARKASVRLRSCSPSSAQGRRLVKRPGGSSAS